MEARKVAKAGTRAVLRRVAPKILYPVPRSSLQPERLYAYLDALWQRRELPGAIVEVGCWLGGTSALAWRMLQRTGHDHRYLAIDTFNGFVPEQFVHDEQLGTTSRSRYLFSGSSLKMVRTLLDYWDAPGVELIQADIASLPSSQLPQQIAVCLVDVDLEIPVLEALRRVFPLLQNKGVILVDDCEEEPTLGWSHWAGARIGYQKFVSEHGLREEYFMGMGVVFA